MGHSFGHDVPSDWGDKADDDPVFRIYKQCGMWTHDEAAILFHVAMLCGSRGWVDIGAHTGWTTAHIGASNVATFAVEPMLSVKAFWDRFDENHPRQGPSKVFPQRSAQFFASTSRGWYCSGFVIDGDHEPGKPLEDAQNAAKHLAPTGVIMLHDGTGQPVQEAVQWLIQQGFQVRAYFTPHLVFCCWRGDFKPPDHVPDQRVKNAHLDGRYNFNFGACV